MKNILPEYLRMRVNAAPKAENVFTLEGVRITVITPRLIRIEQGNYTDEATLVALDRSFSEAAAVITREGDTDVITTGSLTIRYTPGKPLSDGLTIASTGRPAFVWRFGEKPLQNLGGTTSTLDNVDGACAIGDGVCAVDGYTFIDDSASPLMTEDGWFAPRRPCTDVYFFGYGHDYTGAVADYCRLTGRPQMLPAYALGNWWSRYYKYTEESYLGLMDRFADHDMPLSVGIVDMDWHLTDGDGRTYHDGWTGYTWNRDFFPDHKRFIAGLHKRGLKTALNLHPAQGVRSHEVQYEAMARAVGIDPETKAPVRFNCLDPKFLKAYFETLHFPYEADGVDFWWMDWQQGNDYDEVAGKDREGKGLEAITPLWMLNHMHFLASQRNGKRGMIFSRFGGYGSQRCPIGFSGDTCISWASLAFQPYFTATASNIGYGWWSHDIGGHMLGRRDDELNTRWIQFGVFSPIFRLHSSNSLFNGREPWTYNKRAELVIGDFMRLRHRLFPYLYTMNRRAETQLIPLMRPLYHTHPECTDAYKAQGAYWFGSELIAAPITSPADASGLGASSVWLPEGVWTDAFTGYVYRGNQLLRAHRPLETMPLFMRAGAIIPMQAHVPGEKKLGGAKDMEILVAPGASGSFILYEDDGESLGYKAGAFCETAMTLDWQEKTAVFTIAPTAGDLSLVPETRSYTVRLRGFKAGCRVSLAGKALAAEYDAETATCTVVLPDISARTGVSIRVENDAQLTHDNADCRERCIELLIRAQYTEAEKIALLKKVDEELAAMQAGNRMFWGRLNTDAQPLLAGAMLEHINQVPVKA